MNDYLEKADYKDIFRNFSEISKIPRGSGNEAGISSFLMKFAKEHQLDCFQDKAKNVTIIKEAADGYEKKPAIMLQGHMDMVCEKRKDSTTDFSKDPIKLMVDGDYLHADGTTLGADDGIAVAYIMSLLTDETLKHPRMEAVLTTNEEVNMSGAKALDPSALQGKIMINIDSEEEGHLLCSSAGGLTGITTVPVERITEHGKKFRVSISGLKGGHSGLEIGKNRSSAIKLMGRLLFELKESHPFGIITIQGGFKDNVIPREAAAELIVTSDNKESLTEVYKKIKDAITELTGIYRKELSGSEPELSFLVDDLEEGEFQILNPVSSDRLLFLLVNIPYGVQVMSSEIGGLVESSVNIGIFNIEEDKIIVYNSIRSSKESYKHYLSKRFKSLAVYMGGEYNVRSEYPGWEYKKDSIIREKCKKIYKELFDKEMIEEATHAGLECGYIIEKMPDLDIVSIGPDIFNAHRIEEKISISSAIRIYKFLEQVIGS